MVLVGALRCVGGVIVGRVSCGDSARALLLAHDAMAEIMCMHYLDPDDPPVFGVEAVENGIVRSWLDDVDDFHGWSAQPIQDAYGFGYSEFGSWRRAVSVEWVQPANPAVVSATDQGVKRITVTVSRDGEVLAELVQLRTDKYTVP